MRVRVGLPRKIAIYAMLALAFMASFTAGSIATAGIAAAQTASNIVVQGNKRVDADTIRSYFQTRPGEKLDAAKIDEGLKALYATGLYADVKISQSGGRLIVTVFENATINRVAFEGNKKVKDEVLAAEVQSRVRGALSRPIVQADVQRIIEVYRRQGRYNILVEPKIIDRPNGRVDLVFEINEGDKTTVRKIAFIGNKNFSDWKLSDIITTGQTNWLSWLKNNDIYDPDRVSADQELLRRFYLKNGYADFRILSATVDADKSGSGGFVLTFTLDEGEQYRFGTIDIVSNLRDADPAALRRLLRTTSGSVYNAEEVEKSIEELTIELSKLGYAFAQVRPRGDRDFTAHRINVAFVIEEGSRVYVERINIRGNTRTRDGVIRREFDILEGDPYNRVLIDRSERRLKNLGYFKTVKITNEPGSAPDRVIVNVDVEEQLTGEFSVSGGYSTQDGIIGEVSVGERNLLGRGQTARISGTFGQRVRGGQLSFTEPFFLGYRVAAGFDIFARHNLQSTYQPFDNQTIGVTLRAALPLREDLTIGGKYSIYQRKVSLQPGWKDGCGPAATPSGFVEFGGVSCTIDNDPVTAGAQPGDPNEVSVAFKQFEGSSLTSLVGYWVNYNTLDNNRDPTRGLTVTLSQDFAGAGGDVNFIRTTGTGSYFHPVTGDITAMMKLQSGHVTAWGDQSLRILDHFFQGPNLVRGFAPSGIGPRDLGSTNQDALGGSLYWGATAELQFGLPLVPKDIGIKGAVFADAGSLWNYTGATSFPGVVAPACPAGSVTKGSMCLADSNKLRTSAGVSLIWSSPFGPLRFDYAFALTKEPYDKLQAFRFGAGGAF